MKNQIANINDLKIGDRVYSVDFQQNATVTAKAAGKWVTLRMADGQEVEYPVTSDPTAFVGVAASTSLPSDWS